MGCLCGLQFFEVDLPQVSQKKIELVDAVIPDKEKVLSESSLSFSSVLEAWVCSALMTILLSHTAAAQWHDALETDNLLLIKNVWTFWEPQTCINLQGNPLTIHAPISHSSELLTHN